MFIQALKEAFGFIALLVVPCAAYYAIVTAIWRRHR